MSGGQVMFYIFLNNWFSFQFTGDRYTHSVVFSSWQNDETSTKTQEAFSQVRSPFPNRLIVFYSYIILVLLNNVVDCVLAWHVNCSIFSSPEIEVPVTVLPGPSHGNQKTTQNRSRNKRNETTTTRKHVPNRVQYSTRFVDPDGLSRDQSLLRAHNSMFVWQHRPEPFVLIVMLPEWLLLNKSNDR